MSRLLDPAIILSLSLLFYVSFTTGYQILDKKVLFLPMILSSVYPIIMINIVKLKFVFFIE